MTELEQTAETPRRSKRRAIIAGALAFVAVGGIGAAATSAAWTDNVFFSAAATAATFNLQGSLDNATWVESDNKSAIQLVVPASTFQNLLPGQSHPVTLYVKNDSSVNATLAAPTYEWAATPTFTTNPTVALTGLPSTLAPGASASFTLTVSAPADWADSNKGKSGTIIVTVAGTAS